MTVISETVHKARKIHTDDGWEEIYNWAQNNFGCNSVVHELDKQAAKQYLARKNSYHIHIGDVYVRQFNKYDGDIYIFKMNKEMYELAVKYELFQEN